MSKHTINGFIVRTQYGVGDKHPIIDFRTYRPTAEYSPHTVVVGEHSFEVEVPDDFDPRPAMVAALEEQKREVRAKLAKELMEIDKQISELLCIESAAVESSVIDA